MIRRSVVSLFLTSSALWSVVPVQHAHAASAEDAQIQALQREMLEMRREMSGQISALRQRLAKAEGHSATATRGQAVRHAMVPPQGPPMSPGMANDIAIGGGGGALNGSISGMMRSADLGTPPSDRGIDADFSHLRQFRVIL
ncbi:hypothetical protein [Novacetimonas pomaceti]|nr:hypothetical protein [Novacetimonas pomaceti]